MLLDALNPRFAEAQKVAKDDKRLKADYLEYPSPQGSGTMRSYLARLASASGKLPGILVVHENRGLNPHIEDIARRLALDNFMVFPKLDQTKTREEFVAAANYLKGRPDCTGKIGVVGFCYGGGIANMLATRLPDLALKSNGVKYQMYQYPATQHGFNNDTTPRYNEAAAKLAWDRTVEFFNKNLRTSCLVKRRSAWL
jgi:carboxymethylenebutenolidase